MVSAPLHAVIHRLSLRRVTGRTSSCFAEAWLNDGTTDVCWVASWRHCC